jgi:hypothetical protein
MLLLGMTSLERWKIPNYPPKWQAEAVSSQQLSAGLKQRVKSSN